jgi:NAD(P)H-hydrate epimerase
LSPFEAAQWGVYFHGRAGDVAVRGKSELSLTASDLIEVLPKVLK